MEKMKNWLATYFTKRNVFRIVVIELQIIGLLLCVVLAMSVRMEITLRGEAEMVIDQGSSFTDPGAVARADKRPVDVQVRGTVDTDVVGTYTLRYCAKFLLTSKEVTRTVHVVAPRLPVLRLQGQNPMTVTMGTQFVDPGCMATDCDGKDISNRVQVTGQVDVMQEGTYHLTYQVVDEKGRMNTLERTVIVEPAKQPEVVNPDGKVIYLTFDDGPGVYTQRLLEILAKYDVKVTFFVVASNSNLDVRLNAIAAAGHSLGIHSMTHELEEIYASDEAFLQDMYGVQELIYQKTGITTTLLRFPGGTSNTASKKYCEGIMTRLAQKVTDLGFQYFDWDVDSNDAGGAKTADEVYQNVVKGIGSKKSAYVLMHDIKPQTVDAIERIIQWGLENGYTFLPLTSESPACHHKPQN